MLDPIQTIPVLDDHDGRFHAVPWAEFTDFQPSLDGQDVRVKWDTKTGPGSVRLHWGIAKGRDVLIAIASAFPTPKRQTAPLAKRRRRTAAAQHRTVH